MPVKSWYIWNCIMPWIIYSYLTSYLELCTQWSVFLHQNSVMHTDLWSLTPTMYRDASYPVGQSLLYWIPSTAKIQKQCSIEVNHLINHSSSWFKKNKYSLNVHSIPISPICSLQHNQSIHHQPFYRRFSSIQMFTAICVNSHTC